MTSAERNRRHRRLRAAGYVALAGIAPDGWVPAAFGELIRAEVEAHREEVERIAETELPRGRPPKISKGDRQMTTETVTTITIEGYAIDWGDENLSATAAGDAYEAVARELYPDAEIVRCPDQHRTYGGSIVSAEVDDHIKAHIEHVVEQRMDELFSDA